MLAQVSRDVDVSVATHVAPTKDIMLSLPASMLKPSPAYRCIK